MIEDVVAFIADIVTIFTGIAGLVVGVLGVIAANRLRRKYDDAEKDLKISDTPGDCFGQGDE